MEDAETQLDFLAILDAQRPSPLLRPASCPWQGPTAEQVALVPGRAGGTKGKEGPTEAGPKSREEALATETATRLGRLRFVDRMSFGFGGPKNAGTPNAIRGGAKRGPRKSRRE